MTQKLNIVFLINRNVQIYKDQLNINTVYKFKQVCVQIFFHWLLKSVASVELITYLGYLVLFFIVFDVFKC